MAYLTTKQLNKMGFMSLGANVKISDKAAIYNAGQIEVGSNSRVDDFCVISGRVQIGMHTHVTPYVLLAGGEPGIYMGDFCTLAYGVKVFSQSDDYSGESLTNSLIPKKYKNECLAKVTLGRHVIVGAGSTVFPGVDIAEGCSIGAMSLVLKPTRAWGVYAGVPARRMKERSKRLLDLETHFLKEKENEAHPI